MADSINYQLAKFVASYGKVSQIPESTCPEVFSIGDEGTAEVIVDEVPEENEDSAQEAADNCPVSAITVE